MLEVIRQDYIRTARAKGLKEEVVVWRHAFRNALFPIITVLASLFPASIAGSVVLEVIFAIPGMGLLTYDAIFAADWPVVFSVLILGALLTMIGIWVSDFLYGIADPRVRLGRGEKNGA
ncbi:MAG: ABC transporter permease [Saprospirales bacterium]|nr:ABC transporter permease [Saprospirales bacterium]